jgi:hypothetical protein
MKLGFLITYLRISDNQCNGATHTHQQLKKSKTSPTHRKILETLFWERKGLLLGNFLLRGDSINAAVF